jgi:hypothetical protein
VDFPKELGQHLLWVVHREDVFNFARFGCFDHVKNNDAVLSPMAQPERDTELPECHCKNHSGKTLINISRRLFRQLQTLIYRPETVLMDVSDYA